MARGELQEGKDIGYNNLMKIVIDGRWIKQTGIGRYIEETLRGVLERDSDNQYVLMIRPEDRDKLDYIAGNLELIDAPEPWFTFREQTSFWWRLRKQKADLVHFTNFDFPILYRGKFVITVHDLTLLEFKNIHRKKMLPFYYHIKDMVMRFVLKQGIARSELVLVPTEYVKAGIVAKYGVPARKVVVTPEAAEMPYKRPRVDLLKFGINKSYLLYVGNAYPHKNLERLIIAFGKLITEYMLDYQLVIAGRKDHFHEQLEKDVAEVRLDDRVIFTGYVSDAELAGLYKKASLYVFPSLSEGFGLPALEAMSYGVPVASSDATCLPEVAGEAAEYFDATDTAEMAKVMAALLSDKDRQQVLVERGEEQLKKFSWSTTAELTHKGYLRALRKK